MRLFQDTRWFEWLWIAPMLIFEYFKERHAYNRKKRKERKERERSGKY